MALEFTAQALRRLRGLEVMFHLPRNYYYSMGLAALSSVIAHMITQRRKAAGVPQGDNSMDYVIHLGLDAADDIYNLVHAFRRSGSVSLFHLKGALIGALEASIFSSSIHRVMDGVLGAQNDGRFDTARTVGGIASFAATIAAVSFIGGYYEHRALSDQDYVSRLLSRPERADRIAEALARRLGKGKVVEDALDFATSAPREELAKAIGDVQSLSLTSVAVAALVVAPVVGTFVEGLARWVKNHATGGGGRHQVLESSGGRKTRSMMDLPYDPGSPPNAVLVAWSGIGENVMRSVVHSQMPMGHVLGELAGHTTKPQVRQVIPFPKHDPGVDYQIVMRDAPIRRIALLKRMERKLALEV